MSFSDDRVSSISRIPTAKRYSSYNVTCLAPTNHVAASMRSPIGLEKITLAPDTVYVDRRPSNLHLASVRSPIGPGTTNVAPNTILSIRRPANLLRNSSHSPGELESTSAVLISVPAVRHLTNWSGLLGTEPMH